MKKFRLQHILLMVLTFGLFQCSESDDLNPVGSFTPDYQNQPLQGKIAGQDWTSVDGSALSLMLGSDTFQHEFAILDTLVDTTFCTSIPVQRRSYIRFFIQDENPIVEPGERKLKLDFNNLDDIYTVTFVSYDGSGVSQNNIATRGAYEILTVDTANRVITGRMDIPLDDNNFVNGDFRIRYCEF